MFAIKSQKADLVIRWPKNSRRVPKIIRTGRCPSYAVPHKALLPGALVILADDKGGVQALFRLQRIEERISVFGANGNRYPNGCILVARSGSARVPSSSDPMRVRVNQYGIGAFAYFDSQSGKSLIYGIPGTPASRDGTLAKQPRFSPLKRHRFLANNVSCTLQQPERELIASYGRWVGDENLFEHHFLRSSRLYIDLFIRSLWTLIEAKSFISRVDIRQAVGQLFDYQRYYERHPRLAVLLPMKPTNAMLSLLAAKRIAVIWRSRGGSFRDSIDGTLTGKFRKRTKKTMGS